MSIALKTILALDVKSKEFEEAYFAINKKYFTFDNPDEFQTAVSLLNMIINRGDEDMTILAVKLYNELFKLLELKTDAVSGAFEYKDKMYYFKFYDKPEALDKLQKFMNNTVIVKAKEQDEVSE